MSDWQNINIDKLDMTLGEYKALVDEYLAQNPDVSLSELNLADIPEIDAKIQDKSPDEQKVWLSEVRVGLENADDLLKEIKDGLRQDADVEGISDAELEAIEKEIDELQDVGTFIDHDAVNFLEEHITQYGQFNLVAPADQDVAFDVADYADVAQKDITISVKFEDGGAVQEEMAEKPDDLNADGTINSLDYDLQAEADDQNVSLSDTQDCYCTGNLKAWTDDEITLYNPSTDQTFHLKLALGENNNVFIDTPTLDDATTAICSNLSETQQQHLYIGKDATASFWDCTHVDTPEEKREVSDGYEDVIAACSSDLTKECVDVVYDYMNSEDKSTITMGGVISSDIVDGVLAGQSDEVISEVLIDLTHAFSKAGTSVMSAVLGGNSPAVFEKALMEKEGGLTAEDMATIFFLEAQTGGTGLLGSSAILTAGDPTTGAGGTIFFTDSAGNITITNDYFKDKATVVEALGIYKDMLSDAGLVDDGSADKLINGGLAKDIAMQEAGVSVGMTEELLGEVQGAIGWYYNYMEGAFSNKEKEELKVCAKKYGKNSTEYIDLENELTDSSEWNGNKLDREAYTGYYDGIGDGEFQSAVRLGMDNFMQAGQDLSSVSMADMALTFRTYVNSLLENKGDVAAGIMYSLAKKAPNFLKALLVADPNLKSYVIGLMDGETNQWLLLDDTRKVLRNFSKKAEKISEQVEEATDVTKTDPETGKHVKES